MKVIKPSFNTEISSVFKRHTFRLNLSLDFTPPNKFYSLFKIHGFVHLKNILIYTQQDATLHSLFYLETALHVSGGTTTHHQDPKQLYLRHLLFVTPLLLSAAIVEKLEPV